MTRPQTVFLLGAGYIGQPVVDNLLAAGHKVTTLVRSKERAEALEKAGVKTVIGTLEDLDTIKSQAAEHELTINTSSSDDPPSVDAILAGVRQRVAKGLPATFIQTSGAGLFLDEAKGHYKSDKVYSDDDPASIDALPDTALHRNVDLAIVKAARELGDKANIVIMIPPLVYGVHPTYNRLSMALPTLISFTVKHGFSGQVNEGRNAWHGVHVNDLARAFIVLVDYLVIADSKALENPYFFASNDEPFTWAEAAENISRSLHKAGKIASPEPKVLEAHHSADLYGPMTEFVIGGNAMTRSVRLPALGWVPKEKSIWKAVEDEEIPCVLATRGSGHAPVIITAGSS